MPNTPEHSAGYSAHLEISGDEAGTTETLLQKPRSQVEQQAPSGTSANVLVAIAYGTASIVTTLANKALLKHAKGLQRGAAEDKDIRGMWRQWAAWARGW